MWASSDAGEARLLGLVQKSANEALAGHVAAQQLELGLDGLSLRDVELRDPDGEVVARAERIEARVSLPSLLWRRVLVRELHLVAPELLLVQDDRGFNLSRAVAAREEKP
ncbi:MAG: hypothetical protein L0Y66_26800, partial [Myxococcaceae bacterium]|nr:hypothetical protein [Myxococcaceae bacterium]